MFEEGLQGAVYSAGRSRGQRRPLKLKTWKVAMTFFEQIIKAKSILAALLFSVAGVTLPYLLLPDAGKKI